MDNKKIFDAHIHFNDNYKYNQTMVNELVSNGLSHNVGGFLCASFDLESSKKAIEISKQYQDIVYAGIAIHPNDVHNYDVSVFDDLAILAKNKEVVCIGETGLDYFYSKDHIEKQKSFLIKHIELANKFNKALQVHIRDLNGVYDAYLDAVDILKKHKTSRIIVHCFSATSEIAKLFLDIGCYINIGGAVTFKNAKSIQEAAKMIPLERMLVETDAPYLAPHPNRGKINIPEYLNLTVEKIAEIKCVSKEEVILHTTINACKIFGLN